MEFFIVIEDELCMFQVWTTIRDDFAIEPYVEVDLVVEPKVEVGLVEKEGGNPFCSDHFLGGAKNYPLCKPMVDHNQKRVKA